jgi:predicted nucleotidyltransferase
VDRFAPGTGFELSAALRPALARAVERAGPGLESLILSGSHATGEAVWAELDGHRVSLSDVDLYAIMRDEAAAARARNGAPLASERERREWGVLAPVEVAFVTLHGLARMPARPGTVELARAGRVVAGDPGTLARVPRWQPEAIGAEERLLLLENRAFELLWADAAWTRRRPRPGAPPARPARDPQDLARARRGAHAVAW